MRTVVVILLGVFLLMPLMMPAKAVYGATATEVMTRTMDDVLAVLRDPQLKDEASLNIKKEKLWKVVDTVFDYQLLAQYSLGLKWRRITPEQQTRFSELYSLLLGKTYMDRILSYVDEKIVMGKEIPLGDGVVEVRTTLLSNGTEIPIHYRLTSQTGTWKIFDVVIEGVSMTKNYRSQFKSFLSRKSMDQLLAVLEKKTVGVRPGK